MAAEPCLTASRAYSTWCSLPCGDWDGQLLLPGPRGWQATTVESGSSGLTKVVLSESYELRNW
jgi:hypothetical protein